MRPPSVYANPRCPAGCPCDLLGLLHGPHRLGLRLVMILLSHHGLSAAAIAGLLGCDQTTVRRWIHRYNTHGPDGLADRPRAGRPRRGSHWLGQRLCRLLAQPKAWTIARLWQRLGRPVISQRTLRRRVREVASWRRPRLVAKGDPDRDQVLAGLRHTIAELPDGAVLLAEDETHVNLLPWIRSTWIANGCRQQVMTPGTNRRRTIFGAVDLHTGRFLYQVTHKAAHPRMLVLHGARYSPHDNPTERIWAALKAWLANAPTSTIQGRLRQVHAFFRQRTTAQLLATAAPHTSPWLPESYMQNFRQAA
jgi:transposase